MNDNFEFHSFVDMFRDYAFAWGKDQEVVAEHKLLQMEVESKMAKKQKTEESWVLLFL